ncbi:MAG: dipeptidase, partial [Armatimonadetes bacterium]|nr:dipeptidase [Armatimonadota bacterium]
LNRVGVIVDVAHSGWRTSLEAAKASIRPMVASHTTCAGLNHHIRAKPDEVMRAIVDGGGLVGICCIPHFLGRTGDLTALLDHVEYVVKKFGVDHVGIGTDVGYRSRQDAGQLQKVPARARRRTRYEAFWPEDALLAGPEAARRYPKAGSLAWTNWPLITVGLVQRGYSDGEIQKILGQNMLRVLKANHVPA